MGGGGFAFAWGVVLAVGGLAQLVLASQGRPLPVRGGRGGAPILFEIQPPGAFASGAILLAFGLATTARVVAVVFGRDEWIVVHAGGIEGRIGRRRVAIAAEEVVATRLEGRCVVIVSRDAEGRPRRLTVHGSQDPAGLHATIAKMAK